MEITASRLQRMLMAAAEMGASSIVEKLNLSKKQIIQADAYRTYGRKRITEWRRTGEIKPILQGGRIYYDRDALEKLSIVNRFINGCPEN